MQATKIWKNLPLDLTLLSSVVDYLSDTARQPVRVWLFSHFSNQIFIHHPFYFGIFWEKGPLTAKIKNTILVALESAESLYQSSNFMRSTQNLKKSSLWSEHLLSKCTKHEENCSNFFLRNLNVISLVFILFFDKNMQNFNWNWRCYWVKTTVLSKQVGDFFEFWGLLIISELYC